MLHDSDDELLDIVDSYSQKHPKFDNSFVISLRESLNEYDSLTDLQREALEKIIKEFRMKK